MGPHVRGSRRRADLRRPLQYRDLFVSSRSIRCRGGDHMVLGIWRRGLAFSLFALLTAGPVSAQVTGSIAGTVRDSSGAVLPGVTVTIKGPALQRQSVTVTTVADGTYRIPLLPPGVY